MRQSEPWGAITVTMEAHSKQRGLPPRMHEPGKLKYGQKGQRVPSFKWSTFGANFQGWDSKDLGGRTEEGPEGTSRPGKRYGIWFGAGKVTIEEHETSVHKKTWSAHKYFLLKW